MKKLIGKNRRKLDHVVNAILVTALVLQTAISPQASIVRASSNDSTNTEQVVISTTIPTTSEEVSSEVEEEVRLQEALEKKIKKQIAEQEKQERIKQQKEYIDSIVCDPSDVTRVSNLKASDYKLLTKGTWWAGNEQALIDLEKNYGINAMFAMSVSTLESYYGKSDRANSRNNYYGIELSTYWDSLYSNTQYWGGMMRRVYTNQGIESVWSIGPKYCPPNRDWENFMYNNMTSLYSKLINKLEDTVK